MADDLKILPTLYTGDYYAWCFEQSAKLRNAAKVVTNDRVLDLDWLNLAEEIEDMGRSEKRAFESYCEQIVLHLYKLRFSKMTQPKAGWRHEVLVFRMNAEKYATKTILNLVKADLKSIHKRAFRLAKSELESYEPGLSLDDEVTWTLDQILGVVSDGLTDT